MQDVSFRHITTDTISWPLFTEKNVEVSVLRLDTAHPIISGNKWFKLRFYLEETVQTGKKHIITFGGAYSNHILATAAACKLKNLLSTGIIRGEEPAVHSSTLKHAAALGMQLVFVSRDEYAAKKNPGSLVIDHPYTIIPEGGYGELGARGAATILEHCDQSVYTHICCAAGTGTMTAGIVNGSEPQQKVTAISVLKNNNDLDNAIRSLVPDPGKRYTLLHDYHFGGYAKYKPALIDFMNKWYSFTGIPSDFVYTGKLFFAINDLAHNNYFPAGSRILVIHSGGLQGNISLPKGTLIF